MRRTKTMSVGEVLGDFLKSSNPIARKIVEAKVPDVWAVVAGNRVAAYTTSIQLLRGVMYVHISSAAARSEIFMRRSELKDQINIILGMDVVNVIIVK